jgi:uncharacterized protein YegP (UPF0339 family)
MFRPCGKVGRVTDEPERCPGRGWMSASSDLKFVIFRDLKDGYRWRLSSPSGQTVERSERGHLHKGQCAQEVYRLKDHRYPYAKVLDAATG